MDRRGVRRVTAAEFNRRELEACRLTPRHLVAIGAEVGGDLERAVRAFQASHGLTVDGKAGTATRGEIERVLAQGWRPTVDPIPTGWEQALIVYGDPHVRPDPAQAGRLLVDRAWEGRSLTTVSGALIPGYARRLYMHHLVAPHFVEAMRRSQFAAPGYKWRAIGCFNPRTQRFDPSAPPSDHTLGIAFDVNPAHNRWAPDHVEPFEDGWGRYSDLPRGVVESWESVGFDWGGRWKGGRDTMHFSLRRIRPGGN